MCFLLRILLSAILYSKCSRKKQQNNLGVLCLMNRGAVGPEGVGTAFPCLFHVLLLNELEAVLK